MLTTFNSSMRINKQKNTGFPNYPATYSYPSNKFNEKLITLSSASAISGFTGRMYLELIDGSSDTLTINNAANKTIYFHAVGGGGGGSNGNYNSASSYGGNGGNGGNNGTFSVTIPSTINSCSFTVIVGQGGQGGKFNSSNGTQIYGGAQGETTTVLSGTTGISFSAIVGGGNGGSTGTNAAVNNSTTNRSQSAGVKAGANGGKGGTSSSADVSTMPGSSNTSNLCPVDGIGYGGGGAGSNRNLSLNNWTIYGQGGTYGGGDAGYTGFFKGFTGAKNTGGGGGGGNGTGILSYVGDGGAGGSGIVVVWIQ